MGKAAHPIRIGCAGWALRKDDADECPPPGSHLERYARTFNAVEINSSFYRPHRRSTYERWAESVPEDFKFSVKVPRDITHKSRLVDTDARLGSFLDEVYGLGDRLGPLLVQLPPSLAFEKDTARTFFSGLREQFSGAVVCEARHATWFERSATAMLKKFAIGRVAADPAKVAAGAKPAGYGGLCYYRLHGSPRVYYSSYDRAALDKLAVRMRREASSGFEAWCIFDNTAAGAALANARELQLLLDA